MTTVPEANRALFEIISNAEFPEQLQVSLGVPRDWENFTVMIGGGQGSQEWGAIGDRRRDEEFSIDFMVSRAVPGEDQWEAHDAAWLAWQAIDDALRENHATVREDSSKGVLFAQIMTASWQPTLVGTEGYGFEIVGAVQFNATT